MNEFFTAFIKKATGAFELKELETIQNLWSGYGKIIRYKPIGSNLNSIVVKHVSLPKHENHPRGWNTNLSHERKIKSYKIEMVWYTNFSNLCDDECRVPRCLALNSQDDEVLIVLEDLDESGFSSRKTHINKENIETCLAWLANFHATFMGNPAIKLWSIGTYWHLQTRSEELKLLDDIPLKNAAQQIDDKLNNCQFKTIVHGDAKLANFCFSPDGKNVAAVDFQYVGGGCGMKDVAYFIGSCLHDEECEKLESELLDTYFSLLKKAIKNRGIKVDFDLLEIEWRELYPVAWTDFHRFLKGWSPGHWKINSYSEKLSKQVLTALAIENKK